MRGQAEAIIVYARETGALPNGYIVRGVDDLTRRIIAIARLDPNEQKNLRTNNLGRSKVADAIIQMAETMVVR